MSKDSASTKEDKKEKSDSTKRKSFSLLFRRLSVFYLFILLVVLAAFLFFFKYVPQNKDELNERGLRVLSKIANNLVQKNNALVSSIKNLSGDRDGSTQRWLKKSTALDFKTDSSVPKSKWIADSTDFGVQSKIVPNLNFWQIKFPPVAQDSFRKIIRGSVKAGDVSREIFVSQDTFRRIIRGAIKIDDFSRQILNARDDVFSSYLLLLESDTIKNLKSFRDYYIIGDIDNLSSSDRLNLDSLDKAQQMTDRSGVMDIMISGKKYKIFLSPVNFGKQRLIVCGVIPTTEYNQKVSRVPASFIAGSVMAILILFVLLPFIKVFFLSAHEIINARDVFACTFSLFVGSSVLVLISQYLFINSTLIQNYNNQLDTIANQVQVSFESEMDLAGRQLKYYDNLYTKLKAPEDTSRIIDYLTYNSRDSLLRIKTDATMIPRIYRNFSRVFWVSSEGMTKAKWNPYDFQTPLTNLNNLPYYSVWKRDAPQDDSAAEANFQSVYAGRSDATYEFQVYIVRNSKKENFPGGAIAMAANPMVALYPNLPEGFGFCIAGAKGEVLIHSDFRRNLRENIFQETNENPIIHNAVQFQNPIEIGNVNLYGEENNFVVRPIRGLPLSLFVFYKKSIFSANIFRVILFSIQAIFIVYLCLSLIIATYLLSGAHTPIIRFQIQKTEWIRPSFGHNFYHYAQRAFLSILIVTIVFYLLLMILMNDLSTLLYIAVLVPVYTLWMYQYLKDPRERKETNKILPAAVIALNLVFFWLIVFFADGWLILVDILILSLFQGICFRIIRHYFCLFNNAKTDFTKTRDTQYNEGTTSSQKILNRQILEYRNAVFLSIVLIAIMPVLGIIGHAIHAEKLQIKKGEALTIARLFEKRLDSLIHIEKSYKPTVLDSFQQANYIHDIRYRQSIFLPGPTIKPLTWTDSGYGPTGQIYDQPYRSLMDHNLGYINPGALGNLSIRDSAADGSWSFSMNGRGGLNLESRYPSKIADDSTNAVKVDMNFTNPVLDFWHQGWSTKIIIIVMIIVIVYFARVMLTSTLSRLFFFNYIVNFYLKPDQAWLTKKFEEPVPQVPDSKPPETNSILMQIAEKMTSVRKLFVWAGKWKKKKPKDEKKNNKTIPSPPLPNGFKDDPAGYFQQVEWLVTNRLEEKIFDNTETYADAYERVWQGLPKEEQFVLFDFALDKYTNYKMVHVILNLCKKGVLIMDRNRIALDFFSLSFRNYILGKQGSEEIEQLRSEFQIAGAWESMRIPIFSIIAVAAIFLVITQGEFTQKVSGILASIAALLPLVFRLFEKKSST